MSTFYCPVFGIYRGGAYFYLDSFIVMDFSVISFFLISYERYLVATRTITH